MEIIPPHITEELGEKNLLISISEAVISIVITAIEKLTISSVQLLPFSPETVFA